MKKAFFVLPFVFLVVLSSVVSAGYYEFQPDGVTGYDNFISAGSELEEGRNYGGHYVMYVGSYADLTHHGLTDFPYICDSIPEDEIITDVKLQLKSTVDVIGSPDLRIYPLKTEWEEGTGAHASNNKNRRSFCGLKSTVFYPSIFGIENCQTKVRGIKPTIFNKNLNEISNRNKWKLTGKIKNIKIN